MTIRELSVSHVLEGSVRREAGRVRIAAQLIQVSDETHVWAETYERCLGGILKLQSEMAQAVAKEIRVKLAPQEKMRLASLGEVSPAAYEAYLKGRHLWNKRTEEGMRKSIGFYEEAIRQNPPATPNCPYCQRMCPARLTNSTRLSGQPLGLPQSGASG